MFVLAAGFPCSIVLEFGMQCLSSSYFIWYILVNFLVIVDIEFKFQSRKLENENIVYDHQPTPCSKTQLFVWHVFTNVTFSTDNII